MVDGWTPGRGLLRWEDGSDALPSLVGEGEVAGAKHLDRRNTAASRPVTCSPCCMAALGNRLMAAAKAGPGEMKGEVLRWFDQCHEQPAHLRCGQRDQLARSPFCAWFA